MQKTPFTISKELQKQINIELLLLAGLISPIEENIENDEDQEYCLSLDGINYCWVTLKVIRDYLIQKNELDFSE